MTIVCAWCGRLIRGPEMPAEAPVSHGVCRECARELKADDHSLRAFLNRLEVPVVAVDGNLRLLTVSDSAAEWLQRDAAELEGLLGGEALACAHARLPGGCGQPICCRTCTIRRTVTSTYETGQGQANVAATVDRAEDDSRPVAFRISTEKVGGYVLLRIEDVPSAE